MKPTTTKLFLIFQKDWGFETTAKWNTLQELESWNTKLAFPNIVRSWFSSLHFGDKEKVEMAIIFHPQPGKQGNLRLWTQRFFFLSQWSISFITLWSLNPQAEVLLHKISLLQTETKADMHRIPSKRKHLNRKPYLIFFYLSELCL